MSFKYINPGYAELLSVSGGTTVTGEQYSKTGVSFWQPSYKKGLDLSEVPAEFYAKFDVYLKNIKNGSSAEVEIYIGDRNGLNLQAGRWGRGVTGYTETSIVFNKSDVDTNIRIDAINTVWLHIKPGNNADGISRAPHGARGLKRMESGNMSIKLKSRPARGAWIETSETVIVPDKV